MMLQLNIWNAPVCCLAFVCLELMKRERKKWLLGGKEEVPRKVDERKANGMGAVCKTNSCFEQQINTMTNRKGAGRWNSEQED